MTKSICASHAVKTGALDSCLRRAKRGGGGLSSALAAEASSQPLLLHGYTVKLIVERNHSQVHQLKMFVPAYSPEDALWKAAGKLRFNSKGPVIL